MMVLGRINEKMAQAKTFNAEEKQKIEKRWQIMHLLLLKVGLAAVEAGLAISLLKQELQRHGMEIIERYSN